MVVPASVIAGNLPETCLIEGVPLYQQIDGKGCGAVSLQMVFDYYGEFVDQREIYNAARSGGTALPDMARAAQFSSLSTTVGDRFPNMVVTGYTARSVGYAGFYYASETPWLEGLKEILAMGYPVITLVEWMPEIEGPHYRVIVGYDDNEEVMIINDGWSRELKDDMGYVGSSSSLADPNSWDTEQVEGYRMTYDDFLLTWRCPTGPWGVPDLAYGAVLVVPWEVSVSGPAEVVIGEEFRVSARIEYPCVGPFLSGTFPSFPASDTTVSLSMGAGISIVDSAAALEIGTILAGEVAEVSWTLVLDECGSDLLHLTVSASGLVSGSLDAWKDYPAYDYVDLIGGAGGIEIAVV
ncbi:MAG: C39 family peptidase [Thermoplasmata archaeon]|nr:C39 family peptidase [Thermoplasmata archaeon]